jgi:hypothetical protein
MNNIRYEGEHTNDNAVASTKVEPAETTRWRKAAIFPEIGCLRGIGFNVGVDILVIFKF